MKKILIKSKKINNSLPSGGQFYSAFSTINALFKEYNTSIYVDDIILGVYYPHENENNLKKYLRMSYKRDKNIIYPVNSELNKGKWDYIHLLTEDMIPYDIFSRKVFLHIRGIQDWVIHKDLKEKTKYGRHLFIKYLSRVAYKQFVPSTHLKNELISFYHFSPKNIVIMPNGYDSDTFKPVSKETACSVLFNNYQISITKLSILHVSDLSYKKNIEGLFNCFKLILKKIDANLLIVGGRTPELIEFYKRLAEKMGISDNLLFVGRVRQEDLVHFYGAVNLSIFPSRSESFGKPALEAMACGCPTIVSVNTAASDYMKDSELLVNPHDIKQIASIAVKILTDIEYAVIQSQKAIDYSKEYTWENVAQKLISYYLSL
jgi:glycosyltransferase involved in cell wall biosynthesis